MDRVGEVRRKTKETDIEIRWALDGRGEADVDVSIGFMAHMIETLARHGLFDMVVRAKGDLHVDSHHLVEDLGIALGQALDKALGERRGIRRAGHFLYPMDDALAQAAVDLSGRPYLVYKVELLGTRVGELETSLLEDFFRALADHAKMNLHMLIFYCSNDHHAIEALFKAFARALRSAVEIDGRAADQIPSTKGSL